MKNISYLFVVISTIYMNASIDFTVDNQTDFELSIDLETQTAMLLRGPIGGCSQVPDFMYHRSPKAFSILNEQIGSEWLNVKIKPHTQKKVSIPEYSGDLLSKLRIPRRADDASPVYMCTRFKVPNQRIRFSIFRSLEFAQDTIYAQPIFFKPEKTYIVTAISAVDDYGYIVPRSFRAVMK